MLEELYIDNFKSLREFKINFSNQLTVLIGSNSVGKSTVLQAVDFLAYFATGDLKTYLEKHNWKPSELRSKLYHSSKRNIIFKTKFNLNNQYYLEWEFTITIKKDEFFYSREKVTDLTTNKVILLKDSKTLTWWDFKKSENEIFPEIQVSGSMLSLIDIKSHDYITRFPQLTALKKYVAGIKSFELLSPEYMKKTSRYDSKDLGIGGERLGSFLHSLSPNKRNAINNTLKRYYPHLDQVVTNKKQYGHVHLLINEIFGNSESFSINANYISDGLLRIIAIVSLGALDEHFKVLLLDELEDGINPNLAAELIDYLNSVGQEYKKQIIVTTHSPVMLNYFNFESIVFLWRDENGKVLSQKMFESKELLEQLDYMNPGEIWLNFDQGELEELFNQTLRNKELHVQSLSTNGVEDHDN